MAAAASLPQTSPPFAEMLPEQGMLLRGISWKEYVIVRELLDRPNLRMIYCEGELELMTTSRKHEQWKTMISRILELYAFQKRLRLYSYGSTTFQNEAVQRGAEPDACYRLDRPMRDGEYPDIVIEVIYTRPLVDKLKVYKGFGVPEVWLFKEATFELHRLKEEHYERVERSEFLPELDFGMLTPFVLREDQAEALFELEEALRNP